MELFFILLVIFAICEGKAESEKSRNDDSIMGDLIGGCCKLVIGLIFLPFTILFSLFSSSADYEKKERNNYLNRGYN